MMRLRHVRTTAPGAHTARAGTRGPFRGAKVALTAALTAAALTLAACGTAATGAQPSPAPPAEPSSAASSGTDPSGGHGLHSTGEPAPAAALREGERFATVGMPAPYTPKPPNGGTDEYRCFMIDPALGKGETFLTGAQFTAKNTQVVHHAILFTVPPENVAKVRAVDAAADGEGWTCFGDAGVRDASWIGHWAPGANEVLLDPKLGYSMREGSMIVMQVHYSTLALDGAPAGADQSSVRLRLASGPRTPLSTELLAAPVELPCTEQESGALCEREAAVTDVGKRFGEESVTNVQGLVEGCAKGKARPGPTQHCDMTSPAAFTLHAMAGHMHLLGRSIKVELNPGKKDGRTLLDVPDYNFDNQELRPLAEPVSVRKGDVLRVTCTHDAGLRAQLPLLKELPPRYVVWGEGTQDEMCLGIAVASASS
ncbi:monooxygenase [Nonomuraea longicatena]